MTAIARIFTPEGFVVAADGRQNSTAGEVESDEVQKIFRLDHPAGKMCFAVAGVGLYSFNSGRREYVSTMVSRAAVGVAAVEIINSEHYAELLKVQIRRELDLFGDLSSLASGIETKTYIYLDGYILGTPMRHTITLDYESKVNSVELDNRDLPLGHGSSLVWDILFNTASESRLSSYRRICRQPTSVTLSKAICVCLTAILAHSDSEALTIDRAICGAVGGHIHIATVTPGEGFKWVLEQEPIRQSEASMPSSR